MKKSVLSLMVGTALLIAPMAASAMTPMTTDGMKDATGQAGVSIAIDGVKLESWVGASKYTDEDGITSALAGVTDTLASGASVVIGNKHTVKYFNAITTGALSALAQANGADAAVTNMGPAFIAKALTIDVGTCTALSAGLANNKTVMGITDAVLPTTTVAGVVIGLPTLEIITTADTYNVGIEATGAMNSGKNFIKIEKGASVMAILGGTVEIAPH